MPTEDTLSILGVLQYIQDHADRTDIDTIVQAINARRQLLQERHAATVKPKVRVKIVNIRPAYLASLTGTVTDLEVSRGKRLATVRLDADSTAKLAQRRKYGFLTGQDSYDLAGIPAAACKPLD